MEQLIPGGGGVRPARSQQLLGDLLQSGGDILHRHVKGGLTDRQVLPQLVHLKAELLQQRPVGQQDLPLLGGQAADGGGQQALGHGVIARRLHPVKVHPLMGGVLVDQIHRVPPLHDDIGVEHLPSQAPALLLGDKGGVPGGGVPLLTRPLLRHRHLRRSLLIPTGQLPLPGGIALWRNGAPCGTAGRLLPPRRGGRGQDGGQRAGAEAPNGLPLSGGGGRPTLVAGVMDLDHAGRDALPAGGMGWGGGPFPLPSLRRPGRTSEPGLVRRNRVLGPHPGQDGVFQLHLGVGVVALQGGEDRVVYGGKYLALLAELHLGLGGVDVHIHSGQL